MLILQIGFGVNKRFRKKKKKVFRLKIALHKTYKIERQNHMALNSRRVSANPTVTPIDTGFFFFSHFNECPLEIARNCDRINKAGP